MALIFAPDRRQATILLDYIAANLTNSPMLSQLVTGRTQDTITLSNHVAVTVRSSDYRRIRGATFIAVAADELGFLRSEEDSSCSDKDVLDAVRPGLGTTNGPMLLRVPLTPKRASSIGCIRSSTSLTLTLLFLSLTVPLAISIRRSPRQSLTVR